MVRETGQFVFLLNGGLVSSGWTDKHSLTMSGPQMVPSAAGMNLVSHRCPVLWHHNDLQMSWWARTHREHSQKWACTRWEPFNLPGLHLTTPTSCFYSNGQSTFPTNKKACQNQSLCCPKETRYYRCICFFPQYDDNNGWWGVGRPATAGRRPDCIWQTVRERHGLQKLATLVSGSLAS